MANGLIAGAEVALYRKAIDAAWQRNKLINHNIANKDVAGYKRLDIKFEDELRKAVDHKHRINLSKLEKVKPEVFVDKANLSYRWDGNNVDMDTEMAYSAENSLRFQALVNQMNYNFSRLKMVMNR
ncbi:MAG: flagellar basal body rod protein FlgB [Eubacteriales bacterium]|nr:flagellar basal body rod protein FlgB [Eubacteriales bacterium]